MVDFQSSFNAVKDFMVSNYLIITIVTFLLILGIFILMRRKTPREQSISQDINDMRMGIRDLDKLLGDLHEYFKKIEKKIDTNYIRK